MNRTKILQDLWAKAINKVPGYQPISPWSQVLADSRELLESISPSNGKGQKILCATSVGSNGAVLAIDSIVAMGLSLRGARPHFLLCDQVLAACETAIVSQFRSGDDFVSHGPQRRLCSNCFSRARAFYRPLPVPFHQYSNFISEKEIEAHLELARGLTPADCFEFMQGKINIGEHVRAGVLRFFGCATLEKEWPVQRVAARYLAAALTTSTVAERVLDHLEPECVVAHHGIYVPQGILGSVARDKGIRVVNWGPSYRNTTAIFSHGDTYHRTMMDEPMVNWQEAPWTKAHEAAIDNYLLHRKQGKGDWSWMANVPDPVENKNRLFTELGLDKNKPIFGLLTNVLYDANLFYQGNAFSSMLEWLFTTIEYFCELQDLQLIIRIHPHEHQSSVVQQKVLPEIRKRYQSLPRNLLIIPSESDYSTYALMDLCRAVLIYGTKTGVEIAPTGIPVVVAGEAWIRNKGITHDISSKEQYLDTLKNLAHLERSGPERIAKAKKFAYHFFFRRMIPLAVLDPSANWPPKLRINDITPLLPDGDKGLDVICDGIMRGTEFIYDPHLPEEDEDREEMKEGVAK